LLLVVTEASADDRSTDISPLSVLLSRIDAVSDGSPPRDDDFVRLPEHR
jgi:hypothetical protein